MGLFVFVELKREIAIWKRTARHMRVVSLEEQGVRDMLLRKAQEVQLQLREQLNHKYFTLYTRTHTHTLAYIHTHVLTYKHTHTIDILTPGTGLETERRAQQLRCHTPCPISCADL